MRNEIIKRILEEELEKKDLIYPFVSGLTRREKKVLAWRGQKTPKSLQFIGEKLGITRERARQIENKAKQKISYQKEIVRKLSVVIGRNVFDEEEVERAFTQYMKKYKKSQVRTKLEWISFIKILWKQKNEE